MKIIAVDVTKQIQTEFSFDFLKHATHRHRISFHSTTIYTAFKKHLYAKLGGMYCLHKMKLQCLWIQSFVFSKNKKNVREIDFYNGQLRIFRHETFQCFIVCLFLIAVINMHWHFFAIFDLDLFRFDSVYVWGMTFSIQFNFHLNVAQRATQS